MRSSRFMVVLFLVLALLAFAAQFVIDFTADNIAASCVVLASSLLILLYILWTDAIQTHPLSTFAIFGFCVTSQLGALLAQSASGTSLTHNLRQPLDTFVWLAAFQGTALLAHALYRTFSGHQQRQQPTIVRAWLERAGLYSPPTVGTLWFMGLIGLFGQLMASISQGAIGKAGHGFEYVAWAPFLIPMFAAEGGQDYCDKKLHYPFLFLYICLIAFIGLAANARGIMLSGLMTISIFSMLRAMRSDQAVTVSQVSKFALLGLLVAGMAIPVSDLMVAMSIARDTRSTSSPLKMVEDTFYYVTQPEKLEARRANDKLAASQSSYDETYFDNPLLGRLMETKFHDNAMYFGTRLSERDQDKLWDITGDFLWTTLPDPALNALKIDVDKEAMRFSMGDYLSYLGGAGGLGGYKTGSAFGHGLAMFGIYFPVIYFLICPILFLATDLLSYRSEQGHVLVSALGMLGIWKLFQYGITTESLQGFFMMVLRGVPQNILIYLLTFWAAHKGANALATLFGASRRRQQTSSLVAH
jgi:hypothetical protein